MTYKIKSKLVCFSIEWLVDFMVFNFIFNIISAFLMLLFIEMWK